MLRIQELVWMAVWPRPETQLCAHTHPACPGQVAARYGPSLVTCETERRNPVRIKGGDVSKTLTDRDT